MCHRNEAGGWVRDKRVRDAGPWIGTYRDGKWSGQVLRHACAGADLVLAARCTTGSRRTGRTTGVASRPRAGAGRRHDDQGDVSAAGRGLRAVDPTYSAEADHAIASAVMVRDSKGSYDGWFWGWYGWDRTRAGTSTGRRKPSSPYPAMGFGQYCTNCHASAKDNSTFAALKNIKGEPGEPLVFLSQNFFLDPSWQSLQSRIQSAGAKDAASAGKDPDYNAGLHARSSPSLGGPPQRADIDRDAAGDLRQRLGEAGRADRGEPVRHLGPMPRLPQRRRHRPAIRHDAAGSGRKADQHLALRHLARLADGACGARSDLLRAARERDRDLPPGVRRRRSRTPASAATASWASASTRSTPERKTGTCEPFDALDRKRHPADPASRRPGDGAGELRRARARRHLLRVVPSHGARQGGHREISAASRRTPASRSSRRRSIRASPASPRPSPATSSSARRTSSTGRSRSRRRSR